MSTVDNKLLEAIAFFEKMLETMPDDRTGLEFLAVAYEQTGEMDKQVSTLARLSEVLLKEGELEHAAMIAEKLRTFPDNPQAIMAIRVAEMIIAKGSVIPSVEGLPDARPLFIDDSAMELVVPLDTQQGSVQSWTSDAAKAEIELVWRWKDAGLFPKEIGMELLHVFMEHPVTDVPTLVSALGLLEERHPEYTTVAFEDLQRFSGLPPIPLERFDVAPEAAATLPPGYMQVKGVVPFSAISGELLVGVLNPVNESLQSEIERLTGHVCHFYLVHPAALIDTLKRLFEPAGA